MRIRTIMMVEAAVLAGVAALAYGNRWYTEPKMEERPVVERRLVCPDGYELFTLSKPYEWASGGSIAFSANGWTLGPTSGTISMQDEKGERWQQGTKPVINEHVCVQSDEAKKHEK